MINDPNLALASPDRTVWIITASSGDARSGLVATFVNSASLVPSLPRLAIGIACHHFTWELIRASRAFAAHLVDEETVDLIWRFGLQSGRTRDKLAGIVWRPSEAGSPILDSALASLDCTVEAELNIGDRTIFVGAVIAGGMHRTGVPLTARRVFELADTQQARQMAAARAHDEQIDEVAIRAWRDARSHLRHTT